MHAACTHLGWQRWQRAPPSRTLPPREGMELPTCATLLPHKSITFFSAPLQRSTSTHDYHMRPDARSIRLQQPWLCTFLQHPATQRLPTASCHRHSYTDENLRAATVSPFGLKDTRFALGVKDMPATIPLSPQPPTPPPLILSVAYCNEFARLGSL